MDGLNLLPKKMKKYFAKAEYLKENN